MAEALSVPQPSPAAPHPNPVASASAPRYALHPRAAWRQVGGEIFVITGDRAFHRLATPTAVGLLRQLAQEPKAGWQLASELVQNYRVDLATAQADVALFVQALVERQIAVVVADADAAPQQLGPAGSLQGSQLPLPTAQTETQLPSTPR